MKFMKALLWGVPALLAGMIGYLIAEKSFKSWSFLIEILPSMPIFCQWVLSVFLTVVVTALLGYGLILTHPAKKILSRIKMLSFLFGDEALPEKLARYPRVLVRRQKDVWEMGWLMETLHTKEELLYKVFVSTSPIPFTGWLGFVGENAIKFTTLTAQEQITQFSTLGFSRLGKLDFLPHPNNRNTDK